MRHSLRTPLMVAIAGVSTTLEVEIRYLVDQQNPGLSIIAASVVDGSVVSPAPWLEPIVLSNERVRSELIEHARAA